ncbi:hypothetical protein HDU76_008391 [Blyttiomyces sp. JEL0837]|nr:hypothetical protein HDU76_008391 [Blyttiomyces sp. JEL0837]
MSSTSSSLRKRATANRDSTNDDNVKDPNGGVSSSSSKTEFQPRPPRSDDGPIIKFEKIFNFRDATANKITNPPKSMTSTIQQTPTHLRSGLLYRSGTPDEATDADIQKILKTLNIKSIIDLRSEKERQITDPIQRLIELEVPLHQRTTPQPLKDYYSWSSEVFHGKHLNPARRRFTVDPIKQLKNEVISSLPWYIIIVYFILILLCQHDQATRYAIKNSSIEKGGLIKLYQLLLSAKEDIRFVFEVLSEPICYPVMIHCTLGKDRTGIIIALLLSFLQVSEESIVYDYSRTGDILKLVYPDGDPKLEQSYKKLGLSEEFLESPVEVMKQLLAFVRDKWGSVGGYLTYVGVSDQQKAKIREIFLEKAVS